MSKVKKPFNFSPTFIDQAKLAGLENTYIPEGWKQYFSEHLIHGVKMHDLAIFQTPRKKAKKSASPRVTKRAAPKKAAPKKAAPKKAAPKKAAKKAVN